jgi:hypothetical protein
VARRPVFRHAQNMQNMQLILRAVACGSTRIALKPHTDLVHMRMLSTLHRCHIRCTYSGLLQDVACNAVACM